MWLVELGWDTRKLSSHNARKSPSHDVGRSIPGVNPLDQPDICPFAFRKKTRVAGGTATTKHVSRLVKETGGSHLDIASPIDQHSAMSTTTIMP